jgi:hypothetical protein
MIHLITNRERGQPDIIVGGDKDEIFIKIGTHENSMETRLSTRQARAMMKSIMKCCERIEFGRTSFGSLQHITESKTSFLLNDNIFIKRGSETNPAAWTEISKSLKRHARKIKTENEKKDLEKKEKEISCKRKRRHKTEDDAILAINRGALRGAPTLRYYKCQRCNGFHLTKNIDIVSRHKKEENRDEMESKKMSKYNG